jgi:hypothetical protein
LAEAESAPTWAGSLRNAFARYIASKEEPPVDPDLLIAREAAAEVNRNDFPIFAKDVRVGEHDDRVEVACALRAIKLYKERSGA